MSAQLALSDADRKLFVLVNETAFVNPFSLTRVNLDQRMSGQAGAGLTEALLTVRSAIERLQIRNESIRSRYADRDIRLLHMGVLFDAFHRWAPDFDHLITRQERESGESLRAPFALEVLKHLLDHGICSPDALRYVGMFYQLRRAFYFIRRELVGSSPSMRELRMHCWNNIFTHDLHLYLEAMVTRMEDFSTLLLGETGSGKGAVARAIGFSGYIPFDPASVRFTENFTASFVFLNLAQFAESLLESELFGHRKGAFTGAVSDRDGLLARCRPHGAIFLDEIGDVPVPVQIKLLQVLQDRTFTPVGSDTKRRFSGRVIAATNRPLNELRKRGEFRNDFYYRLCSDVIEVPPLRVRIAEDSGELTRLVSVILERQLGTASAETLTSRIVDSLNQGPGPDYSWPGNVRELEQAVRRILLSGHYQPEAYISSLPESERWISQVESGTLSAESMMSSYCFMLWKRLGSYEEVARKTGLDRRTVKKYVDMQTEVRAKN